MAEIQDREVEEVGDEDYLRPDKVRAHKEHDKGKVEEVVEDEVAADAGGIVDGLLLAGEEVCDVTELEDKEADPGISVLAKDGFGGGASGKAKEVKRTSKCLRG